jgi:hypothetical protein
MLLSIHKTTLRALCCIQLRDTELCPMSRGLLYSYLTSQFASNYSGLNQLRCRLSHTERNKATEIRFGGKCQGDAIMDRILNVILRQKIGFQNLGEAGVERLQ